MLRAESFLVDRQRPSYETLRVRKIAPSETQDGKILEARRRIGMVEGERIFADCQRAFVEPTRTRNVVLEF
jgi:hypothetical protein